MNIALSTPRIFDRVIVCPDETAASAAAAVIKGAMIIWPCARHLRCFTARKIEVMPGVDLDQHIEGQSLRSLLEARLKTYPYATIESISAHEALAITRARKQNVDQ